MLDLRPTCEHCNKPLPPHAGDAMICSFECTFCAACVHDLLHDVCPNCGGGFTPRPIRPRENRRNGNYLGCYPAATCAVHSPVDLDAHALLVAQCAPIPPERR